MTTERRTSRATLVAWALLLLGIVAVVAAVVVVYPRDAERRLWYPLFALAVVGALAIRMARPRDSAGRRALPACCSTAPPDVRCGCQGRAAS